MRTMIADAASGSGTTTVIENVHFIMTDVLGFRKVCTKWASSRFDPSAKIESFAGVRVSLSYILEGGIFICHHIITTEEI